MTRLPSIKRLERQFARLATSPAEESVAKRFAQLASRFDKKPVEYAVQHLGCQLTHKQAEILESLNKPPYRSLVRSANSQGKCVHSEDRIPLADGTMVPAKDLVGKHFQVLTLVDGKTVPVEAFATWDQVKPVYRIELESGQVLRRTGNHPLWAAYRHRKVQRCSKGRWTAAEGLTDHHLLAVPLTREHVGSETLSDDTVKFLAYMVASGSNDGRKVCCNVSPADGTLADFTGAANALGFDVKPRVGTNAYWVVRQRRNTPTAQRVLTGFGLWKVVCNKRTVPPAIFTSSPRQQRLFLSRLYACNGWVFSTAKSKLVEVGYASSSQQLCLDVQELLLRLGIRSTVGCRGDGVWGCRVLATKDVLEFRRQIGLFGREGELDAACDRAQSRITNRDGWRNLKALPGTRWERIASVTRLEEARTVAITVPGHQTFLTCVYEHNTYVAALKCSHHYDTKQPSETIVTAPAAHQVNDLLFKELRKLRPNDPHFSPKAARLQSSPDHYVAGLTTNKPDAFQGRHSRYLGLLFDEATSIDATFFQRAETMFDPGSEGNHWWLCTFNPNDPASYVYQAEQSGLWHVIELNALEHPNVLAGLRGDPDPFPGAITLQTVMRRLATDCEEVRNPDPAIDFTFGTDSLDSPVWWRPKAPEFESQILGRWSLIPTSSLFSPVVLDRCCSLNLPIQPTWAISVGCDVARFGGDKTAIAVRVGLSLVRLELHSGRDTTWIANRLREVVQQTLAELGRDQALARKVPVFIDDTGGYGCGVVDQHQGYHFIGINNSSKSPDPKYGLMRTYLWCSMAIAAENGGLDLSRLSLTEQQAVRAELTAARYRLDNQNRRCIDPKSSIKKVLGRSPDLQWTPLSRPKSGDPSLLFRQAVLAPTPYTSAGVR